MTRARPDLPHAVRGTRAAWEDPFVAAYGLRWREWARRPEWARTGECFVTQMCALWDVPRSAWLASAGVPAQDAFGNCTVAERDYRP